MPDNQLPINSNEIQELASETNYISNELKNKIEAYFKTQYKPAEMYWDYNDKLSSDQVQKILSDIDKIDDSINEVENELMEYNLDYISELEDDQVNDIMKEFFTTDELDDMEENDNDKYEAIRDYLREDVYCNMNFDELIGKTDVNIVCSVYSNYDCMGSNWYESQSGGYEYKESYFKDMLDFLNINPQAFKRHAQSRQRYCNEKGYSTIALQGRFPNLKSRNGKNIVDIDELIVELENNSSPSHFVFITRMTLRVAIQDLKDSKTAKYVTIKEGTTAGIYSNWEGGGSCMDCDVINEIPIKIKKDNYTRLNFAEESSSFHYTIANTFGMNEDFCKDGGFDFSNKKA